MARLYTDLFAGIDAKILTPQGFSVSHHRQGIGLSSGVETRPGGTFMTKDDILKGTLALSHSNQNYTVTVEGDQIIDCLSDNLGLHKLWIKN